MKTIAFDLDCTINNSIRRFHSEDILKVKPYPQMVKLIKDLKKKGYKITIFTRRNASGKNARNLTKQWLKKYDIPYDILNTSKIHYDVLIDDRNISPLRSNLTVGFIECKMEQIQDNIKKHTYKPRKKK